MGSCLLLVECIMWACGWPVVGLFSIKFEKWVVWKSIWPRGFLGVSIFGHPPPLYRAVVSVDELYEALPFRQCRAFFLKCRCGWAGWVSAWAGVKWGCMGACVPCLGVVSSDAIKWAVCGFLASCCVCGYMCVRMGCKRLVEGFIMVCWCPNSMWCLCGSVGVCTCIWGYYLGLVLASLCCGWLCRDGLV